MIAPNRKFETCISRPRTRIPLFGKSRLGKSFASGRRNLISRPKIRPSKNLMRDHSKKKRRARSSGFGIRNFIFPSADAHGPNAFLCRGRCQEPHVVCTEEQMVRFFSTSSARRPDPRAGTWNSGNLNPPPSGINCQHRLVASYQKKSRPPRRRKISPNEEAKMKKTISFSPWVLGPSPGPRTLAPNPALRQPPANGRLPATGSAHSTTWHGETKFAGVTPNQPAAMMTAVGQHFCGRRPAGGDDSRRHDQFSGRGTSGGAGGEIMQKLGQPDPGPGAGGAEKTRRIVLKKRPDAG